jgi:phosphoribosyl 1,2-cyclic phosphodiesterase
MKITCLASSSEGNCYLIENNAGNKILVEAGLPYSTIRKRLLVLGVGINDLSGCLVSHAHSDHSEGMKQLSDHLTTYSNKETVKLFGGKKATILQSWKKVYIADYIITPFELDHDIAAMGFIIEDQKERLLFVNDTKYIRWNLSDLEFDYIMIEANYNEELIDMSLDRNRRTINSHLGLQTVITTLKGLKMDRVKEIYLLHLSDHNSNEKIMFEKLYEATKKKIFIAKKNGGVKENDYGN